MTTVFGLSQSPPGGRGQLLHPGSLSPLTVTLGTLSVECMKEVWQWLEVWGEGPAPVDTHLGGRLNSEGRWSSRVPAVPACPQVPEWGHPALLRAFAKPGTLGISQRGEPSHQVI